MIHLWYDINDQMTYYHNKKLQILQTVVIVNVY